MSLKPIIDRHFAEHGEVIETVLHENRDAIASIAVLLARTLAAGGCIFWAGNGGSAADSSKRTADRVEISRDSDDSDAPISKAAIKMAKESAAAAKAAAAQKPEQPKVTTKQVVAYVQSLQAQRTPASGDSDPPIKNKKGMTCINGEWHISS